MRLLKNAAGRGGRRLLGGAVGCRPTTLESLKLTMLPTPTLLICVAAKRAERLGRAGVTCLGFGVWGLGFGVWGLRFGVWGLGFGGWSAGVFFWGGVRGRALAWCRVLGGPGVVLVEALCFRGWFLESSKGARSRVGLIQVNVDATLCAVQLKLSCL
ncbi:hypothetical protein T484DRAFT_2098906 [Baffinella frigidus]|nr:hypothetical protein T484DRAFT_2098906 [Cryptophyta sp. CCMP2293]